MSPARAVAARPAADRQHPPRSARRNSRRPGRRSHQRQGRRGRPRGRRMKIRPASCGAGAAGITMSRGPSLRAVRRSVAGPEPSIHVCGPSASPSPIVCPSQPVCIINPGLRAERSPPSATTGAADAVSRLRRLDPPLLMARCCRPFSERAMYCHVSPCLSTHLRMSIRCQHPLALTQVQVPAPSRVPARSAIVGGGRGQFSATVDIP